MPGPLSLQEELERLVAESSASLAGIHETLYQQRPSSRLEAEEDERLLHRLALVIADAPDATHALRGVLAAVCGHTAWPYGEAWTRSRADGCLHLTAEHHQETPRALRYAAESAGFTYPIGVGVPGRAWEAREPLWLPDVEHEARFAESDLSRYSGYVAVAAIPILAGRDPVALLVLHLRRPREVDAAYVDRLARLLPRVGSPLRQRLVDADLAAVEREVSRSFQASPVAGLVLTMATGEVVDVNDRFLALYGYARDELVGANAIELGLWARPADRAAAMMRLLETGEPSQVGAHVRTRAGDLAAVRAVLDVTERAGVRCARAMVVDAGDTRDAADWRALCEALPTGVCVVRGARCLYANAALRALLGLGPDDTDVLAWVPPGASDGPHASGEDASPLGPGVEVLLTREGRTVEVACSAGVPFSFEGAPATLHTVGPAHARERLGSGVVPTQPYARAPR